MADGTKDTLDDSRENNRGPSWERLATRLDLQSIHLFMVTVDQESIAGAAARANMAASAVSKRLQDLEAELGAPLLVRRARGIDPTEAGRILYRHCHRIFATLESMRADLSDHAVTLSGRIRLAANISALSQFLPEDLQRFLELYSKVTVDLQEQTSVTTLRLLRERAVDLGIVTGDLGFDGLTAFPYREDQLAVAVPTSHPLASRGVIKLADIVDEAFVGLTEETSLHMLLRERVAQAGRMLHYRMRVSNIDAVRRLVQAGLGVAVLPQACITPYGPAMGLCAVPIDEPWARRRLLVVTTDRAALTRPARLLLDHLAATPNLDAGDHQQQTEASIDPQP